jgi:hypothetical protein
VKSDDCSSLSKRYKVSPFLHTLFYLMWCLKVSTISIAVILVIPFDLMQNLFLLDADSETIQACWSDSHWIWLLPPTGWVCPLFVSTWYSGPVIACHQSVTWLRYFSKHCQVWISCFECFQLWSELPSGEHKRRLQTVQKWQVPKVLWLQFLQVSCSSPIPPSKCQILLQF